MKVNNLESVASSTATNWAENVLIGSTYLSLMAKITPAGAFRFYARLWLLSWIFAATSSPETAGLSLEEVKIVFRNGSGIREE
jgi:SP family myo-inositol transporter-like MFS transporter 13